MLSVWESPKLVPSVCLLVGHRFCDSRSTMPCDGGWESPCLFIKSSSLSRTNDFLSPCSDFEFLRMLPQNRFWYCLWFYLGQGIFWHLNCDFGTGFVIFSANYTYLFCRTLHKEDSICHNIRVMHKLCIIMLKGGTNLLTYRKILNISPGLIVIRKHFLGGLYSGGLYSGGLIFGGHFVLVPEYQDLKIHCYISLL